ncbi:NERD domain-containing protein [Caldibacillus lycopersici]|uniref:NERD domain-containing protein n=1 Tax=Perspicuibacillus lycopersici TaxID=1325689 RepID=A0AAE3LSS0_9BACI|nr:nuclease-related domain-containing protein [Perspicuibacillus lycopersici]MCU9613048.1 NERD domain-containing protein [Perspicuibacillus lycopersici]
MILKERIESVELQIMRYLMNRVNLTEKEKYHYLNLEKGFEGEIKFDQLIENLQEEKYIINDLLLEVNNSFFQIDTIIILQGVIHFFEIKNYEGDYYLDSEKLYSVKTSREYKNPIIQLKRTETLFRQLLQNLNQNFLVEGHVLFINPEFTLYQAPMDQPIILPTQIKRFFQDIKKMPSKLHDGHRKLAQQLISLHQPNYPFTSIPSFNYEQVRKGITCVNCNSFSLLTKGWKCICSECGQEELISKAVIRSVEEFKLLFPTEKITTNAIHKWCKIVQSKQRIGYILGKHFKKVGNHRWSYYE